MDVSQKFSSKKSPFNTVPHGRLYFSTINFEIIDFDNNFETWLFFKGIEKVCKKINLKVSKKKF